jgi:putative transposase
MAGMTRPYSQDLRERALARYEAGETIRSIGAALAISPSCVSKWHKLKRATGTLAPGRIGGHKKPVLSGACGAWLEQRVRTAPFTLRGLVAELAARGVKTDQRAVWVFVHARGLSFKKKRSGGGAGRRIKAGSPRSAWSFWTRPGSRPTWRRCADGGRAASGSWPVCRTGIGAP